MNTVFHPFEPVYNAESEVLILGTMPSPKSRENGFYYTHPQNRFWRVLAAVFESELPVSNQDKTEFLLNHHIALWDVLNVCQIDGAKDASIRNAAANDISGLLSSTKVKAVFANGKSAYSLYQKLILGDVGMQAIPLPSTSPANCKASFDSLVTDYKMILDYVK
jgi:G:T/U mismatch-specific DNA glycosylase